MLVAFSDIAWTSHVQRRVRKLSHEVHAVVGNTTKSLLRAGFVGESRSVPDGAYSNPTVGVEPQMRLPGCR
jgi:hypothetical protein